MAARRCDACVCFEAPKPGPPGVDLAAKGISNVGRCHRYPAIVSKAPDDFCFEWRPVRPVTAPKKRG